MNIFVVDGGKDKLRFLDTVEALQERGFKVYHEPKHNPDKVVKKIDAVVVVYPTDRMARFTGGWFAGRGRRVISFISEREIMAGVEELNLPGNHVFCKTLGEIFAVLEGN